VLTEFETKLLGIMMMVIMLGMGASLTFKDFRIAFRKPQGILVGLVCQYGIMPFLGYALAVVLGLPPALAIGLILMGCMPGGTTSNIFTYFSKGALALSIMMTICSTLVAVAMVPLLLEFYSQLKGLPSAYSVPAGNVAQVLVVLIVPTLIGIALRKWNPNVGATVELLGGALGIFDGARLRPEPAAAAGQPPFAHHCAGDRHPERPAGGADRAADLQGRHAAAGPADPGAVLAVHRADVQRHYHLVPQDHYAGGAGA